MNKFINDNALGILYELKDTISSGLSMIFKRIMNQAFSHMPTDLWLKED